MFNTKSIGNIGESKVITKFIEYNIPVYIPFGDNEKADLIAEFNNKLNKIQVKTSVKIKNGCMSFDLVSSTLHRKNGIKHIYTTYEIDYFACYNIMRNKIFLIDIKESPKTNIIIRYLEPKNKQKNNINIRYEEDYLIDNILQKKGYNKIDLS